MNTYGRVLLADDEDLFRDTTAELLRKAGYAVDCASDAAEAARMLAAETYDVLISDIKMPGNAELEIVLEVNELAHGLPIILVTGYPGDRDGRPRGGTRGRGVPDQARGHGRIAGSHQGVGCQESSVPDSNRSAKATDRLARLRGKLQELLRKPLTTDVTEPAKSLLALTFEMVAKAIIDQGRVVRFLAVADNAVQPEGVEGLLGKSEMIENALRETIQALEETKHVFKSKRLKELRQQLQGVLGILEREKVASVEPTRRRPISRTSVNR